METFSALDFTGYLSGEFTGYRRIPPHKGQWHGALMFSLICAWMNGWVNNRGAGDLRRQHAHQMETVSALDFTGYLCGEFTGHRWIPPHQCQWHGALMFSLICAWMNGWVNNRGAGDLRRQHAHQMETVSALHFTGYLCGEFTGHRWIPPHQCQWHGALMFSLICAWMNGWVNNRWAGDFRRQHAHYDVPHPPTHPRPHPHPHPNTTLMLAKC